MSEIDLLIPKKKSMQINGRDFAIGKLSLRQTLRFIKAVVQLCVSQLPKLQEIDGESNTADILAIMGMLPEDNLAEVIASFLNTEDIEFCKTISTEDVSEIVLAVCENNDIGKIIKNFLRAIEIIKKQTEKNTPS